MPNIQDIDLMSKNTWMDKKTHSWIMFSHKRIRNPVICDINETRGFFKWNKGDTEGQLVMTSLMCGI